MTGAPCPPGTEAVVQKEHTRRVAARVTLPEEILPGQNIAPQASECKEGQRVLRPGETITPLAVAVMASFGRQLVNVIPRPRLMIITTGSELVAPGQDPDRPEIRDSNGPMLAAMACSLAVERPRYLHAEDSKEAILHALAQAAGQDIVVLAGGVSVGKFDLVPDALESYGAEQIFHKVTQKPGKPLLLARKGSQLVFGLPGNPLSCHFCFHRYVAAAIRQMEARRPLPALFCGRLAGPLEPRPERTYFVPAHARQDDRVPTGWQLHPLPTATSADIFRSSQANCYVEVPPGDAEVPAGQAATFTWIGSAAWAD
jgi:molybdopterin molybdotransferase